MRWSGAERACVARLRREPLLALLLAGMGGELGEGSEVEESLRARLRPSVRMVLEVRLKSPDVPHRLLFSMFLMEDFLGVDPVETVLDALIAGVLHDLQGGARGRKAARVPGPIDPRNEPDAAEACAVMAMRWHREGLWQAVRLVVDEHLVRIAAMMALSREAGTVGCSAHSPGALSVQADEPERSESAAKQSAGAGDRSHLIGNRFGASLGSLVVAGGSAPLPDW